MCVYRGVRSMRDLGTCAAVILQSFRQLPMFPSTFVNRAWHVRHPSASTTAFAMSPAQLSSKWYGFVQSNGRVLSRRLELFEKPCIFTASPDIGWNESNHGPRKR